jgi:hypothetical protein
MDSWIRALQEGSMEDLQGNVRDLLLNSDVLEEEWDPPVRVGLLSRRIKRMSLSTAIRQGESLETIRAIAQYKAGRFKNGTTMAGFRYT